MKQTSIRTNIQLKILHLYFASSYAPKLPLQINGFLAIIEREYPVELLPSVTKARCRMHYSIGVENVLDKNYKSATTALLVSLRSGIHSLKIFYWLARAIARI